MEFTKKIIPPLNQPPFGLVSNILYDGRKTKCLLFQTRGYSGIETYAVVWPPNTRKSTKISVIRVKN